MELQCSASLSMHLRIAEILVGRNGRKDVMLVHRCVCALLPECRATWERSFSGIRQQLSNNELVLCGHLGEFFKEDVFVIGMGVED
jgi:hypothetical protein